MRTRKPQSHPHTLTAGNDAIFEAIFLPAAMDVCGQLEGNVEVVNELEATEDELRDIVGDSDAKTIVVIRSKALAIARAEQCKS